MPTLIAGALGVGMACTSRQLRQGFAQRMTIAQCTAFIEVAPRAHEPGSHQHRLLLGR